MSGNRSTIIFQFNGNSSDKCGVYIINYASASWKIELLSYKNEYNQPTFYEDSEHNLYIKLNATWSNGVLYSSTDINSVTLESNDTSNLTEIDFTYIIPDFYKSYSNLSSLATALGGNGSMRAFENPDADTLTTPGFYQSSAWSNTPQNSGILIMPYYLDGYWKFQLFLTNNSDGMWFRSGSSAGYSPWKTIV